MKLKGKMTVHKSDEGTLFFGSSLGAAGAFMIAGFDGNSKLEVEEKLLKNAKVGDEFRIEIQVVKK